MADDVPTQAFCPLVIDQAISKARDRFTCAFAQPGMMPTFLNAAQVELNLRALGVVILTMAASNPKAEDWTSEKLGIGCRMTYNDQKRLVVRFYMLGAVVVQGQTKEVT